MMPTVIEHLADEFGIPEAVVRRVVNSAPHRYKVYRIPKRVGEGTRTIAQPAKEVKAFQRFVIDNYLNELPIHPAAAAYLIGRGIKENADIHVRQRYLLKMDFRSFFPSIKPPDLIAHIDQFLPNRFSAEDIRSICSICFWKKKGTNQYQLSIGGVSSPFISNTIVFDFDTKVWKYCQEHLVRYSRYADDLAFSTNETRVLQAIEQFVKDVVRTIPYPRLAINEEKTVHSSKKHHRKVTGLILSSEGKVSLGRDRKRIIRAMIHKASVNAAEEHDLQAIKGYLAFAMNVEPEFVDRLRRKYGDREIERILRWRQEE